MRKLILTTASVLALTLAAGGAYAQGAASNPAQPPAQTGLDQGTPQAGAAPANPAANMQQGEMAQSPRQQNMQNRPNQPGAGMPEQSGGMSDQATLQEPHSKAQVRQLQRQLQAQGLYHGRIDGIMGPQTRRAMEQARGQQSGALNSNSVGEGSSQAPATMQQNQLNSQPGTGESSGQGALGQPGAGNPNGASTPYQK